MDSSTGYKCFESIKALATRAPILKPGNFSSNEPVWVITDGSKTGVGAVYGQSKDWEHCYPARFLSKKFSNVQHNYFTHEHETIVVLEVLMKWEDKLLGRKFTLVTDHKGVEYFKTQPVLSPQQVRWCKYLSHFNYDTIHVDGERNQVEDALLCYYKYNTIEDTHPNKEFVKASKTLDPNREFLPVKKFIEIQNNVIRKPRRLKDKPSNAMAESVALNNTNNT